MSLRNTITLARLDAAVQASNAMLAFIRPIMLDSRITATEFNTYMSLKVALDSTMMQLAAVCYTAKIVVDIEVTSHETDV